MKVKEILKKLTAIGCITAMILGLAACGSGASGSAGGNGDGGAASKATAAADKTAASGGETNAPDGDTAAQGSDASAPAAADSGETWEISLSTPNNENGIWAKWTAWFADQVNEKTGGRMTINIFYNNTLGEQKDMFTQLSNGEIEMIVDGTLPVDYYAPEYGFLVAPYLLKGPEHLRAIMDSELFTGFLDKLEANNIIMSAVGLRNPRNTLTSGKLAWKGVDNASDLVIRVPDNTLYVSAWQAIGASCQIIGGGEIYSALQTGVINACEGPWDQFTELKLNELGGSIYETEHVTEFFGLYVSKDWFNGLPEDVQTVINEVSAEALKSASDEVFEKSEENKQLLLDAGFELVDIDTAPLYDAVAPVWEEKFATDWTASTYDEVMSYAK